MGCINSTKKLTEMRHDNVFRVRAMLLQPESPAVRSGFLELNPRELIFLPNGREPVVWALQHLRRYGLNEDHFSFEAGRRCLSGPGIYMFRCQHAERLYHLFQRYVNAVASITDDIVHPSHTLGRPDPHPHINEYLVPAPMPGAIVTAAIPESFSSLDLDSPNSVPSLSSPNEVVHFPNHPSTPGTYVNTSANANSNLYLDHALKTQSEHNNNSSIVLSTLKRKMIIKRSSLDVPPEERAPMLSPAISDAFHNYANVEGLGTSSRDRERILDPAERCYENLSRSDLPLVLQSQTALKDTPREQATPVGVINYIVLDLDQPRSPSQVSPKTCFGSGFSLSTERAEAAALQAEVQSLPAISATTSASTPKLNESGLQSQHSTESSLGYSTIDFIKTCALIKSSTGDFDEESRITRHSKCVQKAYSISE